MSTLILFIFCFSKNNSDLSSQLHNVTPQGQWSSEYSYYRQVGNVTVVNFDIVWGKAIVALGELLSGLPIPPTGVNQINFVMTLCTEDGINMRTITGAITSSGKLVTGAPIAFKERTIGSIVY